MQVLSLLHFFICSPGYILKWNLLFLGLPPFSRTLYRVIEVLDGETVVEDGPFLKSCLSLAVVEFFNWGVVLVV